MKSHHRGALIGSIAVALTLALASACERPSAPAALENTPENRSAQIDRYLESMPPEAMIKDMVESVAARMPDDQQAQFVDLMTKQVDVTKLRSAMHTGMSKHFTADELRALADFYGSPLGKSAMAKFGTYMVDVMPAIQAEMVAAVGRVQGGIAPGAPSATPEAAPLEPATPEAAPPEPPKD